MPACCQYPSGNCVDVPDASTCSAIGGTFFPQFDCIDIDCLAIAGACCLPFGVCNDLGLADCQAQGGQWLGVGTTCAANEGDCPTTEACRPKSVDIHRQADYRYSLDECEQVAFAFYVGILGEPDWVDELRTPAERPPLGTIELISGRPSMQSWQNGRDKCKHHFGRLFVTPWGSIRPAACSKTEGGSFDPFYDLGFFNVFQTDELEFAAGTIAPVCWYEKAQHIEVRFSDSPVLCTEPFE